MAISLRAIWERVPVSTCLCLYCFPDQSPLSRVSPNIQSYYLPTVDESPYPEGILVGGYFSISSRSSYTDDYGSDSYDFPVPLIIPRVELRRQGARTSDLRSYTLADAF